MAVSMPLIATILFIAFFCTSRIDALSFSLLPQPPRQQEPVPSPPPPTLEDPLFSHTQLAPILASLGFQELVMAISSLSDSSFPGWNGPVTLFAPSDKSIQSCQDCSVSKILKEHIVPGAFSYQYLTKLTPGIKLETMSPARCIAVTNSRENATKILIDGVEIAQPDIFNNGLLVIHGLEGFIVLLSPFSCTPRPLQNLSTPPEPAGADYTFSSPAPSIMQFMLTDAMLRLRDNGYGILALAFRVKYSELVSLQNMTVFALEDSAIFAGGRSYVNNVRFHIVPNRFLMHANLVKLPIRTSMQTLVHGESLVVTNSGNSGGGLRINYVPLKSPDTLYNLKIVVHTIFLPFPHLHLPPQFTSDEDGGLFQSPFAAAERERVGDMRLTENRTADQLSVEMEDNGL